MRKKILKIILYIVVGFTIILFGLYGYAYYVMNYKTDPENRKNHSPEKINPEAKLISEKFKVSNDYYNIGDSNKRLYFDA